MEIWTTGAASPRGIMKLAREVEDKGWDGLAVVDSQNLSGDPYVSLAMAATVTDRIGLATAVTNSVTRQAAATATAIASVNRVAQGRVVLGIGRGDSALAHLGRAPGKVGHFETYLRHLQTYLKGEAVPFDEVDIPLDIAPPMSELHLADAPTESRIAWMAGTQKVPVEVAATGTRVIGIGACLAERVMFTLGVDLDRLAWGIETARAARQTAGLDPDGVAFGAYINLACHDNIAAARNLVRGGLTTFARFNVMHGRTMGPWSEAAKAALHALVAAYDMNKHTRGDSRQADTLTDDFIDHFAIVGGPDAVVERLTALADLGLDKVIIGGRLGTSGNANAARSLTMLEQEVMPEMRG
ncbi:MAG: LLM class flavin-dependent oxidoreductase [Alphaproteobacteria bacterium]|jgi:5,10-methylenetetrahydromethanopterin reductase|nr:LLM class flavin-dependent oxidoreductase [Alphaproteobacteria bacterium]MDP6254985.1 LLM class flavin-dependent oxidoreductase [Alphaproteobacteria bacterium]MDP7054497.1 LLM class flavin-dependent oxidoreductase [Alphaproteobacteria bacterium]MDP7231012.1 LLM class flavin-dependent oxidoreductase [Alphaproteobacteria bacterium]MDP7462200.1 LLM class flavin-dependent oxidoreductase [Alphaproteobacteria bacterium]|tara:strand:- start:2065 stop:3132 length:1068 start_codon:yes stop_codon:yes gene_type:complete